MQMCCFRSIAIAAAALSIIAPVHTVEAQSCPAACPADIAPHGGDGLVNVDDMNEVNNNWGPCPAGTGTACVPCQGDVNGDGQVNVDDLLAVNNAWGACPSPSITWTYPVTAPTLPGPYDCNPASECQTFGPGGQEPYTIQDIQNAIASNKKIIVKGSPTAGSVTTSLSISGKTNVELDFTEANVITWQGGAVNSGRFLTISGGSTKIKVKSLRFNGATGKQGGVYVLGNSDDITFDNVVMDNTFTGLEIIQGSDRVHAFQSQFINIVKPIATPSWFGYAGYMENVTNVWLDQCDFIPTATDSADPYGMRVGGGTNWRATNCTFAGTGKAAYRAYNMANLELWQCTFQDQQVILGFRCNVEPCSFANVGMTGVRLSECDFINAVGGEGTLSLYASYVMQDVKMRYLSFTNCVANEAKLAARDDVGGCPDCNDCTGQTLQCGSCGPQPECGACCEPFTGTASGDINWWLSTMCVTEGTPPFNVNITEWSSAEQTAQDIKPCS
jgi:hypothetical protein